MGAVLSRADIVQPDGPVRAMLQVGCTAQTCIGEKASRIRRTAPPFLSDRACRACEKQYRVATPDWEVTLAATCRSPAMESCGFRFRTYLPESRLTVTSPITDIIAARGSSHDRR